MKTSLLFTTLALGVALTATTPAQVTDTSSPETPAEEPSQLPPATLPETPAGPPVEAATPAPPPAPQPIAPGVSGPVPGPAPAPAPAPIPAPAPVTNEMPVAPVAVDIPVAPVEQDLVEEDGGWRINDAGLNDIFQFLAKGAGRQYFHNMKLAGPEYRVTGHLNDGDPLQQMEDLGFMYGLTLYTKGDTIYALTADQLNQLPSAEFHYQLNYLRPTDMEQIKDLVKPVLSPGTGIVNFEPKTNTIIIIDSAHHIEQARSLLQNVDKPKGQIVVETKILRINSAVAERVGVDWSSSLGESGTSIEVVRSLNSVFGLASGWSSATGVTAGDALAAVESSLSTNNVVLSPFQLNGVLRALSEGGVANQVSNPTLITEDNEQATISIIDRVPIITATVNQTQSGSDITEQVRYIIDPSDPTIATDPEKHREIGISVVVTPTVLPDDTIRMRLRPRSAQIVEEIQGQSGNFYPRVTEAMIESISRVPNGHSLVVGGFYGEIKTDDKNKIPILGDIPLLNFFFKSKETTKEQTSLVFIVTPTSYDPACRTANSSQSRRVRSGATLPCDTQWIEPDTNPGPAHEANLRRTLRGVANQTAPYYPCGTDCPSPSTVCAPSPPPSSSAKSATTRDTSSKPRFSKARRR